MVVDFTSGNGTVPAALPSILKSFTKAAIRTQPSDIVSWSNIYFKALADGETLPVKDQLEFPVPTTTTGLSPGALRIINKLTFQYETFKDICQALGGNMSIIDPTSEMVSNLPDDGIYHPWSLILVDLIQKDQAEKGIIDRLSLAMKVIAKDPFDQKVPIESVLLYFDLLHYVGGSPEAQTLHGEVTDYLKDVASYQDNFLTPEDLARPSCPIHKIT